MGLRRTMLFIPGNNPSMMVNAPVLGADLIIFDIEDAVSQNDKDTARILIRNTINTLDFGEVEVAVRINDVTTPYWKDDLETVVPARPDLFIVPKVERREDLVLVDEYILKLEKDNDIPAYSIKFAPILETALGIENAFEIARACKERITGLLMGGEDLATSLYAKRTREGEELLYARQRVVVAARASGLNPYDTVFPDVEDIEGLIKDANFGRKIGYSGKTVISPRHVDIVNDIFSPSEKEIRYAQEVMEVIEEAKKAGKGAVSLYGKMVDAPIVERARQVLNMAAQMKGGEG